MIQLGTRIIAKVKTLVTVSVGTHTHTHTHNMKPNPNISDVKFIFKLISEPSNCQMLCYRVSSETVRETGESFCNTRYKNRELA